METIPRKGTKRPRSLLDCPYCGEKVSKSTFYNHRRDYYDVFTKKWCTNEIKSTLTECVGKLVIVLYHYNRITIIIIIDLICFIIIIIGNEVSSSSGSSDQNNCTNDEKENDFFDGSSAEGIN